MRKVMDLQLKLGELDIGQIDLDLRSRDEIPKVLMGLQSIYSNRQLRDQVFELLEEIIPNDVDTSTGRSGMDLWKILVLASIRLSCNWDYDKLQEIANNHHKLRLMLGHSAFDHDTKYALQTIKDNICLLTPEVLAKINEIIVSYGHDVVGKKTDEDLRASCDSFVVETDVHFPTDINLLLDAMRKTITLIMSLSDDLGLPGWRQGQHLFKKVKKLFRIAQKLKPSKSKDKVKQKKREEAIIDAHLLYLQLCESLVLRANETLLSVTSPSIVIQVRIQQIWSYVAHAERQMDQTRRRVIEGETIPHDEKVFSIFEEHTEWISKGKAGVPQELGLRVCIVKDQFGFLLHHRVMQNETDDMIAVAIVQETKSRFDDLGMCSFDKGFHSPENQEKLSKIIDKVILPRKGKLSAINKEIEGSAEFREARRKHSAVESSINALENHGLDRCRDHGLHGFKRYVGLAVLARNIQIIGHILQQRQLEKLEVRKANRG